MQNVERSSYLTDVSGHETHVIRECFDVVTQHFGQFSLIQIMRYQETSKSKKKTDDYRLFTTCQTHCVYIYDH